MGVLSVLALLAGAAHGLRVVDAGAFSASKLLPIENKDAFFSAPSSSCFGVFDGVSQCPQSRAYSQTLAKKSLDALKGGTGGGPDFKLQAQSTLRQATGAANGYSGASTALLVSMDLGNEPKACCYTIGDCQCMVIRPSQEQPGALAVADFSNVKFHSNGAPYQLAGDGWPSDGIEDGLYEELPIEAGDVVLCFTDGFANNFANMEEVPRAVTACASLSAQEMATKLVSEARQREIVNDDVTVVAIRVGDGAWAGGDMSAVTSADGFDPLKALADADPMKAFMGALNRFR